MELSAAGTSATVLVAFAARGESPAAMSAGIDTATGEILIPMDADLQNNPKDIARLI